MYDEKCLMRIGSNVRSLRTACQLSQLELARRIGISQTHLSNLEHDHVNVSLKLLLRIANVLGCSLEKLLDAKAAAEWSDMQQEADTQVGYTLEEVRQLLELLRLTKIKTSSP